MHPVRGDDPWAGVATRHGLAADEVISALQKEIRRGNIENAALLAYEMAATGPDLETKLWQRLRVISVEDVGWGDPHAPALVHALFEMAADQDLTFHDRLLFAMHAVRYLCACRKDRSTDEMLSWIKQQVEDRGLRPAIPDYALDMHTERGRQAGRGLQHFLEQAALVSPELVGRDDTYHRRLMAALSADGKPGCDE